MAQSSTEAEYVVASVATLQVIWIRRILEDIGDKQNKAKVMFCDNKSAIDIAKNPIYHSKSCHIPIKHDFNQDAIEDREVELRFCNIQDQVAYIFIKALPRDKFNYFLEELGV